MSCISKYLAAAATALLVLGGSHRANADTVRYVDATFTDGATLTGYLYFDTYGYLEYSTAYGEHPFELETSTGALAGTFYVGGDYVQGNGTTDVFDFFNAPSYDAQQLVLTFVGLVNSSSPGVVPIIGGDPGPSFECAPAYSCTQENAVRFIASGVAETPLPSAWTMLLIGLAALGFVAWRRQRANNAA